jgi:monoamine oxidase
MAGNISPSRHLFVDDSKKKLNNTVIVVGGGLAGMSAAIEAHRAGAEVILLEKNARFSKFLG